MQQLCDTNNRQTAIFSLNIDLLNICKNNEKSLQIGKNPYIKAFLRGAYKDSPKRNAPGSNPGKRAKKCREIKVSRHFCFSILLIFLSEFSCFGDTRISSYSYHIPISKKLAENRRFANCLLIKFLASSAKLSRRMLHP